MRRVFNVETLSPEVFGREECRRPVGRTVRAWRHSTLFYEYDYEAHGARTLSYVATSEYAHRQLDYAPRW